MDRDTQQPTDTVNHRRTRIVRPAFQIKYALTMGVVVFFGASVLSCVLFGILHQQARQRVMNPGQYVGDVGWVILGFAILVSGLSAAALATWFIMVTHRICGPIVRLQGYLEEMIDGQLPQVRPLRKNDEFKELFATFERLVKRMGEEQPVPSEEECNTAATWNVELGDDSAPFESNETAAQQQRKTRPC